MLRTKIISHPRKCVLCHQLVSYEQYSARDHYHKNDYLYKEDLMCDECSSLNIMCCICKVVDHNGIPTDSAISDMCGWCLKVSNE